MDRAVEHRWGWLRRARAFGVGALLAIGGAMSGVALAQSPIDPTQQLQTPSPPEEALPSFGFSLELLVPDSRRDLPEEDLQDVRFQLDDIIIEGVTVYPQDHFRTLFEDKIGEEVTLLDLYEIAEEIERTYKTDDYILSQAFVPPQRVSDNVFTIQVIEAFINRVTLEGDETDVQVLIQSYLDKITEDRPVRNATIERYVLLVNEIPGISTSTTFRQSSTEVGASQMVVEVTVDNFTAFNAIDNRGSKYVGPWATTLGATSSAFTDLGERASFLVFMTRDWDEQRLGSFTYEQRLSDEGTMFELSTSYATSELGSGTLKRPPPGGIEIRAKSFQASLEVTHPLIMTRQRKLRLFANLNWKYSTTFDDSIDQVLNPDFLLKDDVRSLAAGFQYDTEDILGGVSRFTFTAHQGLDILGARSRSPGGPETNIPKRRSNQLAPANFTRFEFEYTRFQRFWDDFALLTEFKGQTTMDRLLGSEQFTYGGRQFGRGFDSGEIAGDRGLAFAGELSWNRRIDGPLTDIGLSNVKIYTFYDYGATWETQLFTPPDEAFFDVERLFRSSAGFGINTDWEIGGGDAPVRFNLNIEYAKPLVGGRASDGGQVGREARQAQEGDCCGRDARWYINVISQF